MNYQTKVTLREALAETVEWTLGAVSAVLIAISIICAILAVAACVVLFLKEVPWYTPPLFFVAAVVSGFIGHLGVKISHKIPTILRDWVYSR